MVSRDTRLERLEAGRRAEQLVHDQLVRDGFEIVARNWRGGGGELDVVGLRHGWLRVVEVKLRNTDSDGLGLDAIDWRKRLRLVRAVDALLQTLGARPVERVTLSVAFVRGNQIRWVDDPFDA